MKNAACQSINSGNLCLNWLFTVSWRIHSPTDRWSESRTWDDHYCPHWTISWPGCSTTGAPLQGCYHGTHIYQRMGEWSFMGKLTTYMTLIWSVYGHCVMRPVCDEASVRCRVLLTLVPSNICRAIGTPLISVPLMSAHIAAADMELPFMATRRQ